MPNPKANQQPLDLDRIKADAMSMGIPARALLDMIASGARSAVATTAGLPVDMVNTAVGLHNMAHDIRRRKFEGYETGTIPGGSEDIKGLIPNPVKDPNSNLNKMADFGGDFAIIPGVGTAAMKGAKMVGQEIADRVATGQKLMPGPFSEPQMAMHVVKPKGGNWLNNSVEKGLYPLTKSVLNEQGIRNLGERQGQEVVDRYMEGHKKDVALNNWVNRNLTNYVKKEMATPEDPVRKLAEQGITHFPVAEDPRYWVRKGESAREDAGGTQMGQSDLAKQWENRTDTMIRKDAAQEHQDMMHLSPGLYSNKDEWIKNLPPETPLYSKNDRAFSTLDLGLDHIMDVLREDLHTGRIRPEQLNKVSMEQAVRRTYEYDQEMAKKMAEAQFKITEGMPVHKEYPEGYKWIELAKPKGKLPEGWENFTDEEKKMFSSLPDKEGEKALEDALKYEGDTMGHCVGGYCPDVLEGRSRIFSLRDAKGEPHVTIEVQPSKTLTPEKREAQMGYLMQRLLGEGMSEEKALEQANKLYPESETASRIVQIKGKGNARPVSKYDPFTQDFVKSGNWGEIGDLHNTGLVDTTTTTANMEAKKLGLNIPRFMSREESEALGDHLYVHQLEPETNPQVPEILKKYQDQTQPIKHSEDQIQEHSFQPATIDEAQKHLSNGHYVYALHEQADEPHLIRSADEVNAYTPDQIAVVPKHIDPNPEGYANGGQVAQPRHEAFLNPSIRLANGQVTLDPLEFMPNYLRGGKVHVSDDIDMMRHEIHMSGGGSLTNAVLKGVNQFLKKAEKVPALPLNIPRAIPKTNQEIDKVATRVSKQMLGEHVKPENSTKTVNLANRSMRENERVKSLPYQIQPTGASQKAEAYEPKIGDVNIAIPGDQTISDSILRHVGDLEDINSVQEGGGRYGLGKMNLENPLFWASSEEPAQMAQDKITRLAGYYSPDRVIGQHMAMGPLSNNFAMHLADANLKSTAMHIADGKINPEQMYSFDNIIANGYVKKNAKTGEYEHINFPHWPGVADLEGSYKAMQNDPELRKWYNNRMKTPDVTSAHGLPNGLDIQWAITEPALRNMEVNLTGLSAGKMAPGAELTDTASHNTYAKGIQGLALQPKTPPGAFEILYPDATQYIKETKNPSDFTGTIQKVFPHQLVDDQYLNEVGQYNDFIKKYTGQKKGGTVHMGAGGSLVNKVAEKLGQFALPLAERDANKAKFLANSQITEPVYHAAKTDLNQFSPKYKTELSSMGHHFGTADQANFRTGQYDFDSKTPNIGKYHLNIENPLEVSHMASYAPDHLAEHMMDMNLLTPQKYDLLSEKHNYDSVPLGSELVKILQKNGYDGLKYANEKEGEGFSFVPFKPTQIKSATGNQGTYNINNPDITKAKGGKVHITDNMEMMRHELNRG